MTKPNLIQSLLWRTKQREQAKKEYDEVLTLAAKSTNDEIIKLATKVSDNGTVRLLDEGMVVDAEGYPQLYIKKGAIDAYYEQLSTEHVGSINVGHHDFATFPFLVGEWTKEALSVVDIGEGRKGLEVQLNLYEDSLFIQELKNRDYPIGVSAEFSYRLDVDSSEEYQIQIIEAIDIKDFALVGDAGNVSSNNIQLNAKERGNMSKKEKQSLFEKYFTKYEKLATEAANEPAESVTENGDVTNEPEKKTEPETAKDKEPETKEAKETTVEKEDKEPEKSKETADAQLDQAANLIKNMGQEQQKALSIMNAMEQKITALEKENAELKGKNTQLATATDKGLAHFEEVVKTMNLDVALSTAKNNEDQPVLTDGFGKG